MEKEEIGLIMLFIAVIVGFVAVFQVYDLNPLDGDNGDSPDNGTTMENMPGQFDSLHLSQTTTTENNDFELKMEIWYRKTNNGIDYRQVQTIDENTQIQIYNSQEENFYQGTEQQWLYRELPYENFESGIVQQLSLFDQVVGEYEVGDSYTLPGSPEGQATEWEILDIEKNGEIEDDVFKPPENAMLLSFSEYQAQQMLQQ